MKMKINYFLLLVLCAFTAEMLPKKRKKTHKKITLSSQERSVRGQLNKLINKPRESLTYAEFKQIRALISQLKKFSPQDADELEDDLGATCCSGLPEFDELEIVAELKALLAKPESTNKMWVSKAEKLLADLYYSRIDNFESCSEDQDEQSKQYSLRRYTELANKYEQIAGKKFAAPKRQWEE